MEEVLISFLPLYIHLIACHSRKFESVATLAMSFSCMHPCPTLLRHA
jgi:hypothetical protein